MYQEFKIMRAHTLPREVKKNVKKRTITKKGKRKSSMRAATERGADHRAKLQGRTIWLKYQRASGACSSICIRVESSKSSLWLAKTTTGSNTTSTRHNRPLTTKRSCSGLSRRACQACNTRGRCNKTSAGLSSKHGRRNRMRWGQQLPSWSSNEQTGMRTSQTSRQRNNGVTPGQAAHQTPPARDIPMHFSSNLSLLGIEQIWGGMGGLTWIGLFSVFICCCCVVLISDLGHVLW